MRQHCGIIGGVIIDSHVHVAPDKIAEAAAQHTQRRFGIPLAGGLAAGQVLESMQRWGIDASVVFNSAQSAAVVRPANDFIIKISDNRRLVGLGTVHPEMERPAEEVARLRASGIRGIKFHALLQGFGALDERMMPVYREMGSDMVAYFHCGKDPGQPEDPVLSPPESLARVKGMFPELKIVAAHLGGFGMLEESRKHIVGQDIYIDTSWSPGVEVLDPGEIARLIEDHGSHRVLFGTDYPTTSGVKGQIDWVKSLPLSDEDKERIFWKNAKALFRIA